MKKKTIVYVDGFNLYYGSLKRSPYKWLNLLELFKQIFPQHHIIGIKYFTALVVKRTDKPLQQKRQKIYWRALRTLPNIQIIEGKFYKTQVKVFARGYSPPIIKGDKFEEKRSDVSMGAHLVHDAHRNLFDYAVLVTNDSDLYEPVRIVTGEIGCKIGFIHTGVQRYKKKRVLTHTLAQFVDNPGKDIRSIRTSTLKRSQFPDVLTDNKGTFYRPKSWRSLGI